jgi:hypothetical protein
MSRIQCRQGGMEFVHGSSRLSRCANRLDRLIYMESSMKPFLIIAVAWPLLCSPALAQVGTITDTPALGLTSPLGGGPGAPVGAAGIPMGSTEITSPGVSPLLSSSTGNGTACSTVGTSPSGMFGSTATFDGGGTTSGTMATSGMSTSSGTLDTSGLSGMCGSGSSSIAASSTPTSTSTSPIAPGGVARTGIPMGSTEIGNLGVSSAAAVPALSVSPFAGIAGNPASLVPTTPTVTSPPTAPSMTTSPFPCPTTGLPATSNTPSGC